MALFSEEIGRDWNSREELDLTANGAPYGPLPFSTRNAYAG